MDGLNKALNMDQTHAPVSHLGINIFPNLLNATIIYFAYDYGNVLCITRSEHWHVYCISYMTGREYHRE